MTVRKTSLYRRIAASGHRAAASMRRVAGRKAPVKRRRNPSEEARQAVAGKWRLWASEHHLTPTQIKQGVYVVGVMPDPTRIKDFAALAKMLGARGVNPARKAAAKKRAHRVRVDNGWTHAAIERVGKDKYRSIGFFYSEGMARATAARAIKGKKNGEALIFSRAQFNKAFPS